MHASCGGSPGDTDHTEYVVTPYDTSTCVGSSMAVAVAGMAASCRVVDVATCVE